VEHLESLLREEFDPPATYTRESVGELIATTRRLRRRRTALSSATATLAVILVATLGVLLTQGGDGSNQPMEPLPTPTAIDPSSYDGMAQRLLSTEGVVVGGHFLDARNGYLVLFRCPNPESGVNCDQRLVATSDGGATFATRSLPPGDPRTRMPNLSVFEDGGIVLDILEGQDPWGFASEAPSSSLDPEPTPTHRRWVSADGGRTWREVSTTPLGTVTTIPAGAKLTWRTLTGSDMPGSVTVLTSDGRSYALGNIPNDAIMMPSMMGFVDHRQTDGPFFLTDTNGGLLVSTDRGASWQRVELAEQMVTTIGGAAGWEYLQAYGGPSGLPRLMASNDQGRTWSTVNLPPVTPVILPSGSDGSDVSQMVSTAVLPDGGVLLADGVKLWRLPPGGKAFEPLANDAFTFVVQGYGAAVLGFRGTSPTTIAVYLTTDGEHWERANLG